MKGKYLIFSLLAAFFLSCSRDADIVYEEGTGGVEFSISSDMTDSKAEAVDANINVDDFKIEIINKAGVIFKRWSKYSDYKNQEDKTIKINAGGPYTLRATYGDSTATGFDAFFFKGETKFTVIEQRKIDLSVVCKQGNVKVAVNFAQSLQESYPNFWANVGADIDNSLTFEKNTTEAGYTPKGDIYLWLTVVDDSGKKWYYRSANAYKGVAGDFIKFNVSTTVSPEEEIQINITFDSSTIDTDIKVNLLNNWLPRDAPKIVPDGFDSSGKIAYTEGTMPESASLNLNAPNGLQSCIMTVPSYLSENLGWPTSIDFFNLSSSMKSVLERDGLIWTDGMQNLTLASIDFTELAKIIKYTEGGTNDHTFTVTISDTKGKSLAAPESYALSVVKAQTSVSDINEADIWSSSLPVTMTTNGDPNLLLPKVQLQGESGWFIPSYTVSVSGNSATANITGLQAGKTYTVKAAYNKNLSEVGKTFTTEAAAQVGNAGFEDWTTGTRYTQPIYYPWTTDKWWDTNNNETMPDKYGTYINYKCFPAVNYSTSAHSGSKAAQIRCISISGANSDWAHFGERSGKLFIGTTNDGGSVSSTGHTFTSRPTSMEFYYQYAPNGTDEFSATVEIRNGNTVIGTGSFIKSFNSTASSYTKATANITYSNTSLKATSIYIIFLSSTSGSPNCSKQTITIPTGSYKVYSGSCLTIDDIKMVYGK